MNEIYRLKYEITKQNYAQFNLWHSWQSPARRNYRILLFVSVSVLYFGVVFLIENPITGDVREIIMAILGVALLLWLPNQTKRRIQDRAEATFEKGFKGKNAIGELILTDHELHLENADGSSTTRLSAIHKTELVNGLFLIYLNFQSVVIISKENFQSATDFENFQSLFNQTFAQSKG